MPVSGCRNLGERDLVLNDALPKITANPETYWVHADGELLTREAHGVLPLPNGISCFDCNRANVSRKRIAGIHARLWSRLDDARLGRRHTRVHSRDIRGQPRSVGEDMLEPLLTLRDVGLAFVTCGSWQWCPPLSD